MFMFPIGVIGQVASSNGPNKMTLERVGLVRFKQYVEFSSKSMDSLRVNFARLSADALNDVG